MTNCNKNCINCVLAGYCLRLKSKAVTKSEMQNLDFINDALRFAYGLNLEPTGVTLGFELDFKPAEWKLFIHEAYTSYQGRIIGEDGSEEFLDTEKFFEVPDEEFDGSTEELSSAFEKIRDFFDYWVCNKHNPRKDAHFRGLTGPRLRTLFTVLRMQYPHEAQFWGLRGKAANDNEPQK